ncbi:MAG TPA: DUF4062 domain-containing protein [Thermoanaerobaculia bacterium]|nr:DUF4062 domain-containing protein [Thermoanaerobaculia bacterium]
MKVFLSSTAQDLVAYRKVADDTILRMSQEAVVMERFGPLPGEPVAECERQARESDVVVCIVAHRYGFVPEKGRGSITRREVEAAKAAGREVLVWIVADDFPWTEKKEQDLLTDRTVLADPARVAEVAANVQALLDFKTWLGANFVYDTFTTPDDLGRKIAVALSATARGKCRPRLGRYCHGTRRFRCRDRTGRRATLLVTRRAARATSTRPGQPRHGPCARRARVTPRALSGR